MSDDGDDVFARFAVETGKIKLKERVAHHKLFEPSNGRLSVQHTAGLDNDALTAIGRAIASMREGNKSLHGWEKLARQCFLDSRLVICIDNDPRQGHATVTGWPDDRNERIDIQKKLAIQARVVVVTA